MPYEWGNCEECKEAKVQFSYEWQKDIALTCRKCKAKIEGEAENQGKEVCENCRSNTKCGQLILRNFFKPKGQKCPRCSPTIPTEDNSADEDRIRKLEEEMRKNKAEGERILKIINTCATCQKDLTGESSYYIPGEKYIKHYCANCHPWNKSDSSLKPPQNSPTNSDNKDWKCNNCKKTKSASETYYFLKDDPSKKWCLACDWEVRKCMEITLKIMEGVEVNIDNYPISDYNKKCAKLVQRLIWGEKIDLNNETFEDEEDRQGLKELQQGITEGKIKIQLNPPFSDNPKPKDGYKFASKCLDCKATYDWPNGKPSQCPECKSKNIKVYDQQGQEVQKSKEKEGEIPPYALPLGILFWAGVITLIVWLVKRNKKKKKAKS